MELFEKAKNWSLLSRERGLKLLMLVLVLLLCMSLLSRERGLKSLQCFVAPLFDFVAPLAGAWIEIKHNQSCVIAARQSLLSRERGLKYINKQKMVRYWYSRSLRGSVD